MQVGKKYKPYSKKQLCLLYGVSDMTLKSWLRPIKTKLGAYRGKSYSPMQIQIIFDLLGEPEEL